MQLALDQNGDVRIVRVKEAKLTYPTLSSFFGEVRQLVEDGARKVVIDLGPVTYIDSASIGCLMDIRRMLQDKGGVLRSQRPAAARGDHGVHDRREQDHRDPPRGGGGGGRLRRHRAR